jgi:hypothetical protein
MFNKIGVLALSIAVLTASNTGLTEAAAKINAGSKCSKAGQTSVVASKKFTCIKTGKKLVWDRGILILAQPVFIANPAINNYEWDITITNYQGSISPGLEFSYSFAVDGGMWNLFSRTSVPKEKIVVNQAFNLLEIKVAVSDSNSQYVVSPQFQRLYRIKIVPPLTIMPSDSARNNPNSFPVTVTSLLGVQWRNEPGYYIGNTPASRVLFRWPKPLVENLRGFVIKYENTSSFIPPCDLSIALCEGPKRVDSRTYKKVIKDPSTEFVTIDGLAISSSYEFTLFAISGGNSEIEEISLPSTGFKIFVLTTGEVVPEAPTGVTVG